MAERVGIDRSFLADVERGKRNISILNLELIADQPPYTAAFLNGSMVKVCIVPVQSGRA
jgi:transcriptional regulator with XRE-family HTH domain